MIAQEESIVGRSSATTGCSHLSVFALVAMHCVE